MSQNDQVQPVQEPQDSLGFVPKVHSSPMFFHSRLEEVRSYTVAGKLVEKEGRFILKVAYAIVSSKDRFSKKEGRDLSASRLEQEETCFDWELSEEDIQHVNRAFLTIAKGVAPLAVLPPKPQFDLLKDFKAQDQDCKCEHTATNLLFPLTREGFELLRGNK